MGLISKAIMTGGGIYAVNKLAKSNENRPQSSNQQQQQQQPQGYWGPPPPGQPNNGVAHWYPAPTNNSRDMPIENNRSIENKFDYPYESFNEQQAPAYSQQQQQQGYVMSQDQSYAPRERSGSPRERSGSPNSLDEKSRKGKKSGKGGNGMF